jgi:hypothetical protein
MVSEDDIMIRVLQSHLAMPKEGLERRTRRADSSNLQTLVCTTSTLEIQIVCSARSVQPRVSTIHTSCADAGTMRLSPLICTVLACLSAWLVSSHAHSSFSSLRFARWCILHTLQMFIRNAKNLPKLHFFQSASMPSPSPTKTLNGYS